MELPSRGAWVAVEELGEGGQGQVYLAFDTRSLKGVKLRDVLMKAADFHEPSGTEAAYQLLGKIIAPGTIRFGALKVLHNPNDPRARDPAKAAERMRNELDAYRRIGHPNLLRLLDADPEQKWLVSEYQPKGALNKHAAMFRGRPIPALRVFRDFVDGVASMHRANLVHRDIKPENIFLSEDGLLVLGDMGLVFSPDEWQTRVTETFDKAGTYAWMPPEAMHVRADEIRPSFDVYSLGKVLWSMVTGNPRCPTYYRDGAPISKTCSDEREARLVERILHSSVVDRDERFPDGAALLREVDAALEEARLGVDPTYLKMAMHAISRPGALSLFSIEAPIKQGPPVCQPGYVTWSTTHPLARGKGQQLPGFLPTWPAVFDDELWKDFLEQSPESGRWLIRPPEPRSPDYVLDCTFHEPVLVNESKYLQLSIAVDPSFDFVVYLLLNDQQRVIGFSPTAEAPAKVSESEYIVPAPETKRTRHMEQVVIDLEQALATTWPLDETRPVTWAGMRFRGVYKLLLARLL